MNRKRIYITGGSSGIGLGLAQYYAGVGNDVVILARNSQKIDAAVSLCQALTVRAGQLVVGEPLDITAYDELPGEMDRVIALHGEPDLLILSAGVGGNSTFINTSAEVFDSIVNINLAGSREVARAVLPGMLHRRGQIAFVSSMAGLVGLYGYSAYAASKFAVTGLAQSLRQELWGSGVHVHLVCPPEVNTPMITAESDSANPQTRFLKDLIGTMEPEVAAVKIARGIARGKFLIVPGVRAQLMVWIARHFPEVFARSSQALLNWKFGSQ